ALRAKTISLTTMQHGEITLQSPYFNLGTLSLLGRKISGDYSIDAIRYQSENVQMSCVINGDIDLSLDPSGVPADGSFSITVRDLSIKGITLQGFSIPPVHITSARARATVRSRVLTIDECVIQGKDMNGLIRGTVSFDPVIGRSVMSLTVEISGDSAMLADFKPLIASFINPANGRLSLSVQGAFVNPSVNIVPAGNTAAPAPATGITPSAGNRPENGAPFRDMSKRRRP
ncbi:MAG TPA: type II secretion system protein GspN, partial [Spirochaetota bacterium]